MIAAVLVTLIAAEARAQEPPDGASIAQRMCGVCHDIGSGGPRSPNRRAPPFTALAANPSITADSLSTLLSRQHASMPRFSLAPEQKDALIRYILSVR